MRSKAQHAGVCIAVKSGRLVLFCYDLVLAAIESATSVEAACLPICRCLSSPHLSFCIMALSFADDMRQVIHFQKMMVETEGIGRPACVSTKLHYLHFLTSAQRPGGCDKGKAPLEGGCPTRLMSLAASQYMNWLYF